MLIKKPMVDDKGNKVPEMSIIRDTGGKKKKSKFFFAINSFCCVDIENGKVYAFEELKRNGYIKRYISKSDYMCYDKRLKPHIKNSKYKGNN